MSWRYVILTKLGQHVNEMMAVAVKKNRGIDHRSVLYMYQLMTASGQIRESAYGNHLYQ